MLLINTRQFALFFRTMTFSFCVVLMLVVTLREETLASTSSGDSSTDLNDFIPSQNAVGFVRVDIPKGGFALARYDFVPIPNREIFAEDLFGNQLPEGSRIYVFNAQKGLYDIDTRTSSGWSANIAYHRGIGFWIAVPLDASKDIYEVYLTGEVPDQFTAPKSTISVEPGINQIGYPYPYDVNWIDTQLAQESPSGTSLYYWNGAQYAVVIKQGSSWSDPTLVLEPGMGFFYIVPSTTSIAWEETKPYAWP